MPSLFSLLDHFYPKLVEWEERKEAEVYHRGASVALAKLPTFLESPRPPEFVSLAVRENRVEDLKQMLGRIHDGTLTLRSPDIPLPLAQIPLYFRSEAEAELLRIQPNYFDFEHAWTVIVQGISTRFTKKWNNPYETFDEELRNYCYARTHGGLQQPSEFSIEVAQLNDKGAGDEIYSGLRRKFPAIAAGPSLEEVGVPALAKPPGNKPFFILYLENPHNVHFSTDLDIPPMNLSQLERLPIEVFPNEAVASQVLEALRVMWSQAQFKIESSEGYGKPKRLMLFRLWEQVRLGHFGRIFKNMAELAARLSPVAERPRVLQESTPLSAPRPPTSSASDRKTRDIGGRDARETKMKPAVPRYEWLAKAMLLIKEHPERSNRKIAKAVGIHPSQLARSPEYQAAAALARGQKKDIVRGSKNGITGEIDAEAEGRDRDLE